MESSPDIALWLEQLGLSRYLDLFTEQEIDLSILPDLTDADLTEIGLPLGPRRKIQKAIAALDQPIPGQLANDSTDTAERRHLTVMFADIVGSSAMSTRIDAEDLRVLMRAFQDASVSAVNRFQGFVARFMGDGVLAYFGYPQAHEDDPERGVRAGLELIRLTAELNEKLCADLDVELQVRVGIATGPAVVGDLIGQGASTERSVVGLTPNIAAKIEASAPPGSVAIGEQTLKLLGHLFDTEELPPKTLEGFDAPIRLYRIVSERRDISRFEAKRSDSQLLFVGRREELAMLQSCWTSACASRGNAVLVTGEAGVGKSRFLEEVLERTATSKPTVVQFQCSPFHSNSTFYPIIERLNALVGFTSLDDPQKRRERLDNMVRDAPRARSESVQLLAALLAVDIDESLPTHLLDNPPARLAAMREMLSEQILARTDDAPVVIVFEDAHWIDPTTLETVVQLAGACRNQRLLLVVTSRPDVGTEHILRQAMRTINLSGLSREETKELVQSVPQGRSLAESALNAVVERTDGIPLFIEELTKLVLERGIEDGDPDSSIPTTLVDSLTERLDRLGSAKTVAQIGASIGRKFSLDLLGRIDTRDPSLLMSDIERLVAAELIQPVDTEKSPAYRFKHALVQDAAYGTLLYTKRREYHGRIADILLEAFPTEVKSSPEILAYHLSEGGRSLEAVDYWQAAGMNAINRSANAEAVHHLSKGIETLGSLPSQSMTQLRKELELQIALGPALVAARGYAASELEAAYSRAMEIGEQLEEGITDFRALWGLSSFYLLRGNLQKSLELQRECLILAEKAGNEDWLVLASAWLGTVLFYRNELTEACEYLGRAIEHYRAESANQLGYQFGLDPAVLARVHLVWLYWLQGKTEEAHELDEETLVFAAGLDHPLSHVHALNFSVVLHALQGNYEEALARANRVRDVSGEFEFPHYLAYSRIMRGYAIAQLGDLNKGIDEMVLGLKDRRETGAELVRAMFLTFLAEVLLKADQLAWGIEILDEADAIINANGEDWLKAESRRMRGLILNRQNAGGEQAIACVNDALALARQSNACSLEIRALISLIEIKQSGREDAKPSPELVSQLAELVIVLPPDRPSVDRQRSQDLLAAHGCS